MKFNDFEYDGIRLSSLGYMVCHFGSDGLKNIENGSPLVFDTVSVYNGYKQELLSAKYTDCIKASFQICKNPCLLNSEIKMKISSTELSDLVRWLNRKQFHKFKPLGGEYSNIYFESTFNINRIEINGELYGLELSMVTNRPFALHDEISTTINNTSKNGKASITDISSEEGVIYPKLSITAKADGDLTIYNALDDRTMKINNVKNGEVITVERPIISSSLSTHKIQNDFNWTYFRIVNTFASKKNDLTISIPCNIVVTYSPIVKISI